MLSQSKLLHDYNSQIVPLYQKEGNLQLVNIKNATLTELPNI